MSERFFSPVPRGLEELLVDELHALGARKLEKVPGGVGFSGDWALCWRVNLESRLATRVLWQVDACEFLGEDDFHEHIRGLPWERWFAPELTIRVYVTAIRAPVRSLNFVTLKIKDGVCDRFRDRCATRPSVNTENPDVRIHVFMHERRATIYLDTSGEPLTKRGYKQAKAEAPLKENLAAGILKLTGWDGVAPLIDPMCGSGTFLLEAAMIALDIAPGLGRSFGFEKLKSFEAAPWKQIRSAAQQRRQPRVLHLFGADIDARQVEAARQNLSAAGLADQVKLTVGDVLQSRAPADSGIWVTNPPYGVRLGAANELAEWYPRIGDHLKKNYAGWRCYFFTGDPELPKRIGLKASRRTPLMNGDIECRLLAYEVVAGSNRRDKSDNAG